MQGGTALPRAEGGAVTGIRPKILNVLNCTATLLADCGVNSAVTCTTHKANQDLDMPQQML